MALATGGGVRAVRADRAGDGAVAITPLRRFTVTPAEEQTEMIAHALFHAQHGDWPADLAEARRMVRLAVPLGEAQEMLVALRVRELCREADTEQRNAGRL